MAMKDRIARAFGLDPSQVWRRSGPDGLGWYIRPFGGSERFIGSNGALAVLRRHYVAALNAAAEKPRDKKLRARLERLSKRLEVADPPKRGW